MAHRAGYAAIIGRPNVGKSTLLNALVGAKVAIVTPKPQTTRNRILGIRTLPEAQVVFLDTPGIHEPRSLLNRRMVDVARQALGEADAVVLVVDATAGVTPADRDLAQGLAALARPAIVVLSKRDRVRPPRLLPVMGAIGTLLPEREIIPVSARTGENVPVVLAAVEEALPYGTAVHVEEFAEKPNLRVVRAAVLVDRPGHRGIVIGAGGTRLREIGRRARLELEALLGVKVFLELFVREIGRASCRE